MSHLSFPAAPVFGVVSDRNKPMSSGVNQLYLDDIFDEFLFSSQYQGDKINNSFAGKDNDYSKFMKDDDDDLDSLEDDDDTDPKKRKRSRGLQRNMTEEQKVERR